MENDTGVQKNPMNWNPMVPELPVRDLAQSLSFYRHTIGFQCVFERPENRFAYMNLQGAQLMLVEDKHLTPHRHIWHLQVEVANIAPILERLASAGYSLDKAPYQAWYRADQVEFGQLEFFVRDPDGYLLRFFQANGQRAVNNADTLTG